MSSVDDQTLHMYRQWHSFLLGAEAQVKHADIRHTAVKAYFICKPACIRND